MSKSTVDILAGFIFVIMGLWFAIFFKQLAQRTVDFNNKVWGFSSSKKLNEIGFLISGIVFIIFGTLLILQIIKTR